MKSYYKTKAESPAAAALNLHQLRRPGETICVCGARQWSIWLIRCTHPMVQFGAQLFAVKNSRFTSAVVYSAIGTPGYPRCWLQ